MQARIDSVSQQKDVVDVTKGLFAIAKETAEAEQKVFELSQRTQLASEVKAVLDSWARFEASEREAEQKQLTDAVVRKVTEQLQDEKLQKQILDNAIAEVERESTLRALFPCTMSAFRLTHTHTSAFTELVKAKKI